MTIKIHIITPHTTPRPNKLDEVVKLQEFYGNLVEFSQVGLDVGPASIEGSFDEYACAPGVIARSIEAEKQGVHAVMIDCMGDPGLDGAREAVSIPVLGPGETTMHVAATLGHKFSVVTILDRVRPLLENHARIYGVFDKLASVRAVNIPVLHISDDTDKLIEGLKEQSIKAITEDHADAIVLGCTGFLGVSDKLSSALREAGFSAPVLNPIQTTVSVAISMVVLGLSHSPLAYPRADFSKGIKGLDFLTDVLK